MSDAVWEMEYSSETAADLAFAWAYMSDVANWDDPPAQFELDGPFADGTQGTTRMPGHGDRHWHLREVVVMRRYTVEFAVQGGRLLFRWQFDGLPGGKTRLTQRVVLEGENASQYVRDLQEALGASLGPGMKKIAARIAEASRDEEKWQ
jgi:Polyketide cyclase / dehydrase and lipid transport